MKANVYFSYSHQCVKPTDPVYFSATRNWGKEHCDNFILTAFKCNLNAWSYCKPWEIPDIACQQKVGDARSFCCCLFSLLFQFWELIQKIAYLFSLNLFFSLSLPLYFLIFIYFSSPLTFLSLYRLFFWYRFPLLAFHILCEPSHLNECGLSQSMQKSNIFCKMCLLECGQHVKDSIYCSPLVAIARLFQMAI